MSEIKNIVSGKAVIVGIGIFVIGVILGSISTGRHQAQPVVVAQKNPVTDNQANWKALKNVDDELIASCGNNFNIVSQIFDAQAKGDLETATNKNEELNKSVGQVSGLADERNAALKVLGY